MATGIIVILVIVLVLIAAAALAGFLLLRRRALRRRFGPEYDQLAQEIGARRARAELIERERRVAQLDIRPLSQERRAGYGSEWLSLQERFVDDPAESAETAAALISAVAADRGYRVDDEERLLGDLSVHHADRLDGYRRARDITRQSVTAGTEELRQALLSYRVLFRDLIAPEPGTGQPSRAAEHAAPDHKTPAAAIAPNSRERSDGATDDADGAQNGTVAGAAGPGSGAAADSESTEPATTANAPTAERETAADAESDTAEDGPEANAAAATAADAATAEPETVDGSETAQGGTTANAGDSDRQTAAMSDSAEGRTAAKGDGTEGETGADSDATWADSGRDRAPAPAARKE